MNVIMLFAMNYVCAIEVYYDCLYIFNLSASLDPRENAQREMKDHGFNPHPDKIYTLCSVDYNDRIR